MTTNTPNGTERNGSDRLPPHSLEAEQGILGCVLIQGECLTECELRFGLDEVFYDLRHQEIYLSLRNMRTEGVAIDMVTVQDRLRNAGKLESIGGLSYLAEMVNLVPSAGNLPYYLQIVWEKFLARQQVQTSLGIVHQIYDWNGIPEGLWTDITQRRIDWEAKTTRGTGIMPRELVVPENDYEQFLDEWHNRRKDLQGWQLPFSLADFTLKLREFTLLAGDSGSGKSTWLSEVVICACKQGARACIASFEMPRYRLIKSMVRQLLGTNWPGDGAAGAARLRRAYDWIMDRVTFYNFLGIGEWRRVIEAFTYAHDHDGRNLFVLDSMGLVGISDEDWEQQQAAAAGLMTFSHLRPIHLLAVQHINKGVGNFKQKVRGSKRATDFVDNLCEWQRNDKKKEKVSEICEQARIKKITEEEKKTELQKLHGTWDGKIILVKQRYQDGEQQNASRYLFYDWRSLQFRPNLADAPIDYLGDDGEEVLKMTEPLPTPEELGMSADWEKSRK